MEFLLGGVAACGAGFFTNPLEVAKTRQQLQGELRARGQYTVHYRNVGHAFYTVGKVEGLAALQKGLVPALWYQFFMNGCRLGVYQWFTNQGLVQDKNGNTSLPRCVVAGAVSGCIGASVGSPFYMGMTVTGVGLVHLCTQEKVKTHLQSLSDRKIAVGYQHNHNSLSTAFSSIYKEFGVTGLWRGLSGAMARVMVGSAAQLSTFSKTKEYIQSLDVLPRDSIMVALLASMTSGVVVIFFMTPFDVVSTRLYNQGIDSQGKGLYYSNVFDCFRKICMKEGIWGLYKGWGASLFRLGPHTVLSLVFWNELRKYYLDLKQRKPSH